MENFNYEAFELIAKCTQKDLQNYLAPQLEQIYGKDNCIITKDYLFAKGTVPVCLVSHLDTVHREVPSIIVSDKEKGYIWSPQGIGGDDRCGVYALISIIVNRLQTSKELPSVLFTTFEEVGCIGAGIASSEIPKEKYEDFKFLIEIDRKGTVDCVFYSTFNDKFEEFIESFGFVKSYGSCSDISKLSPAWDVASVNLSSGYFNAHTKEEYISVKWLMQTISNVIAILDSEELKTHEKFEYQPDKPNYSSYGNSYTNSNNYGSYDYETEAYKWWDRYCKKNQNLTMQEEEELYKELDKQDENSTPFDTSKGNDDLDLDDVLNKKFGEEWKDSDFIKDCL